MAAGRLTVNVEARTDRANRNLGRFRRGLRQTNQTAKATAGGLAVLTRGLAPIIAGLSAGAAIGSLRRTTNELEELINTSEKLGIVPQRLREIQFIGRMRGLRPQTTSMALQRIGRRVAEAAQQTGEAVNALEELNLQAEELNQLPLDRQLLRIADAFELVTNQGDKMRLMMKLADSEGVGLINVVRGGSREIREQAAEYRRLAGVLQEDGVENVRDLTEHIAKLEVAWRGLKESFILGFGDEITALMRGLSSILGREMTIRERVGGAVNVAGGILSAAGPQRLLMGAVEAAPFTAGPRPGVPGTVAGLSMEEMVKAIERQNQLTEQQTAVIQEQQPTTTTIPP